MKKLLLVLAGAAMLAFGFTSCGDKPADTPSSKPEQDAPAPEAPTEVVIWEGEVALDGSWDGNKAGKVEADKFAEIAAGGTITIYANGTAQLKVNAENWPAIPSVVPLQDPKWGTVSITDKVSFVLTAEDVDLLKASGMVLFGADITYTKVTYTAAE